MNFTIYNAKFFKNITIYINIYIYKYNILDYSPIFRITVTRGCIGIICLS